LLDVWQLPVQRAEMLKFDGVVGEGSTAAARHDRPAFQQQPSGFEQPRRKTPTSASLATGPGLAIRRGCRSCGKPLAPVEKNRIPSGWHCANTSCIAMNP